MPEHYFWSLFGLVGIFGWAVLWLLRSRSRDATALRRRELLHAERMAAMEKGVPLPELPEPDADSGEWLLLSAERDRARARWLLRFSLMLGFVATAAGLGICAGFYLSADRGFNAMWTIGLIPFMGGLGFLMFWRLASSRERL